jgi:hypothetical protein
MPVLPPAGSGAGEKAKKSTLDMATLAIPSRAVAAAAGDVQLSESLYVRKTKERGRALFASKLIPAGAEVSRYAVDLICHENGSYVRCVGSPRAGGGQGTWAAACVR